MQFPELFCYWLLSPLSYLLRKGIKPKDMKYKEHLDKVFSLIDDLLKHPGTKIIAIDGNAAAGKSVLASRIAEKYDCNIFHMDDFFLPPETKTEARHIQTGGKVEWERFREELLEYISRGNKNSYRKY